MSRSIILTGFLSALLTSAAPVLAGGVLFVDDDAQPGGSGSTWATACPLLQDALELAADPGRGIVEVRVAQGVYAPDQGESQITGNRFASFRLRTNLALRGGFAGMGAIDPDARDPVRYPSILTGDLAGNDGPGQTGIGENSLHVVLSVDTDATAMLEGFTVTGGNANGNPGFERGGGLLVIGGAPTIADCRISANKALVGGGVFLDATDARLERLAIIDNIASVGAGLFVGSGAPMVEDCTILGNDAVTGGGIYADDALLEVTGGLIASNDAAFSGAGVYVAGGGVILDGATISGNVATFDGGGLYAIGGAVTLVDCALEDNAAERGGGAFFATVDPLMLDCDVTLNHADEGGGLFVQTGTATLTNCDVTDNTAQDTGGGMLARNATILIAQTIFTENSAPDGGGLKTEGGHVAVTDGSFLSNHAANFGAGLTVDAGTMSVHGTSFLDNEIGFAFVRNGGAINIRSSPGAVVTNAIFDENRAGFGGAIWADSSSLSIEDSCFTGGLSVRGSALHVSASDVVLDRCVLSGNATELTTISAGGAIYVIGGTLTLNGCAIDGNAAFLGGGGGIAGESAILALTNCSLTLNAAAGPGGSMRLTGGQTTLTRCSVLDNGSGERGGAFASLGAIVTSDRSTFTRNVSGGEGGALSVQGGGVTLIASRFRANDANAPGGAIATGNANLSAIACSFVSNIAGSGGGIFTSSGNVDLTGCLLSGNVARGFQVNGNCVFSGTGGAVWSFAVGHITATNCTVVGNRSVCNGVTGGIASATATIGNCIIWGNEDDGANVQAAQLSVGAGSIVRHTCIQGWTGSLGGPGNIGLDPQFRDLGGADGIPGSVDDDLRPASGSPANDSGDNALVPAELTSDLDSRPRFDDDPLSPDVGAGVPPVVDMGAYESSGQRVRPEDLDGNGHVGFADLLSVIQAWGACGGCAADFDLDGYVGFRELLAVITAWGVCR